MNEAVLIVEAELGPRAWLWEIELRTSVEKS